MSVSTELKRRLFAEDESLSKRLKLAENVFISPWFPLNNKEEIVIQWIIKEIENSKDVSDSNIFTFFGKELIEKINFKCFSNSTKCNLIQALKSSLDDISSKNLAKNIILLDVCISLLENNSLFPFFQQYISEYFQFIKTILDVALSSIKDSESQDETKNCGKYEELCNEALESIFILMKNSRKTSVLIFEFVKSGVLEISLNFVQYRETENVKKKLMNILFPANSLGLYKEYIFATLKGKKMSKLVEQKSETIKPIITIMEIFFEPTKQKNTILLERFIDMFVLRFKSDSTLVFIFYILLAKCLNLMSIHSHIQVNKDIKIFNLSPKEASDLFSKMLHCLEKNNVNVNIFISNNLIEQSSSGDGKKRFSVFIHEVWWKIINDKNLPFVNQLKITHQILKLEPLIILESDIENTLVDFFISNSSKSNNEDSLMSSVSVLVLEIKFKIGRSVEFLRDLFEALKNKLELIDNPEISKKRRVYFPSEFCIQFGLLCSEMIPQLNTKIFETLTSNITDTTTSDVSNSLHVAAFQLLSSYFQFSKMADENIILNAITEFTNLFDAFGRDVLSNCLNNLIATETTNPEILESLLNLVYQYGCLKTMLLRYQANYDFKLNDIAKTDINNVLDYDISCLHSYLSAKSWKKIWEKCSDDLNCLKLKDLLIVQNWSVYSSFIKEENITISAIFPKLLTNFNEKYGFHVMLSLNESNSKEFADFIFKEYENSSLEKYQIENYLIENYTDASKNVLSAFAFQHARCIWRIFEKSNQSKLYEASSGDNFDIQTYFNQDSIEQYIQTFNLKLSESEISDVQIILDLWNKIPIEYFSEKIQLSVLFSLIVLKSAISKPKTKSKYKTILSSCNQVIFKVFELSYSTQNLLSVMPFTTLCTSGNPVFNLATSAVSEFQLSRLVIKKLIKYTIAQCDIDSLKAIIKYCKKELSSISENQNADEVVLNNSLQLLSIMFVSMSSYNNTENTALSKSFQKCTDTIQNIFQTIKWDSKENIDEKVLINFLLNGFQTNESEVVCKSSCNLLDGFLLSISQWLSKKTNNELPLHISKPINYFLNNSIFILTSNENCYFHVKEALILINTILKNWNIFNKCFESKDNFLKNAWLANLMLFKNANEELQNWSGTMEIITENTKFICEHSSPQIFHELINKHLSALVNFETVSLSNKKDVVELPNMVLSKMWSPFLHSNTKDQKKSDVLNSLIKKLSINFYMWLKKNTAESNDNNIQMTLKDRTMTLIYFDMIIQTLGTKKVNISRNIIDHTLQLPTLINFHGSTLAKEDVIFLCTCYDKSINLLNTLISNRSEMIQDRWPLYLQSYRAIVSAIFSICDPKISSDCDKDRIVSLAHKLEKLTTILINNHKQDLTRIAAYVIADIVNNFQRNPITPSVKFHVENCVYLFLQLLDNYAVGFLMRNFNETCTMIFQRLYDNYVKFYKYTGKF